MNRRSFVKILLNFIPISLLCRTNENESKLQFIRKPAHIDSFLGESYEIIKGEYKVQFNIEATQDLEDSHGLCATDELCYIIIMQLEYGHSFLESHPVRRVTLTKSEKQQILQFVNEQRGPHQCVRR